MNLEQDSSTRRTILTFLKTSGPLNVNEMARRLGITEMAVRRHLYTLERDGLIESALVRQAMGRPMHVYRLSEAADDLFPKNYHSLVLDLLGELLDEAGEDQITRLFEKRRDKLLHKYEESLEGKPLEDKVAVLAEIQNANGYMVEWEKREDDTFVLKEYNCPISQVANRFNQACSCELQLFEKLLQAGVERTECLAKGGGKCVYVIKK
jgi:predicted ArsR family transcriptional regulator